MCEKNLKQTREQGKVVSEMTSRLSLCFHFSSGSPGNQDKIEEYKEEEEDIEEGGGGGGEGEGEEVEAATSLVHLLPLPIK